MRKWFLFVSVIHCVLYADCLDSRIDPENARYETFFSVLQLMKERKAKTLVETGTSRYGDWNCGGDGCSTLIFGDWASENEAILYSIDCDDEALKNADNALSELAKDSVHFVQSDSIAFLKDFGKVIDFLYLDSCDYADWDPLPSQKHHLNELIAAYPWFSDETIVMIDDCCFPRGGKGKLVIQYLLERGWKIFQKGYQVILVKS